MIYRWRESSSKRTKLLLYRLVHLSAGKIYQFWQYLKCERRKKFFFFLIIYEIIKKITKDEDNVIIF